MPAVDANVYRLMSPIIALLLKYGLRYRIKNISIFTGDNTTGFSANCIHVTTPCLFFLSRIGGSMLKVTILFLH